MTRPRNSRSGRSCRPAWTTAALAVCVLTAAGSLPGAERSADTADVLRLRQVAAPDSRISTRRAIGTVSFVRFDGGAESAKSTAGRGRRHRAMALLDEHRGAFGLREPAEELQFLEDTTDGFGYSRVRFRQVHEGVPVFGSDVRVHFDRSDRLVAVGATTVPIGALERRLRRELGDPALTYRALRGVVAEVAA